MKIERRLAARRTARAILLSPRAELLDTLQPLSGWADRWSP